MKRTICLFAVIFALALVVGAQGLAVGSAMENFSLPDVNGKVQSIESLKGKNGLVVLFVSVQCPVVAAYNERISKIAADYEARGINFVGINSNASESPERVKAHAAQFYKFPVLIDKGNVIADKLAATVTPEAFYIDSKSVLLYHGAIDNDRSGSNITEQYLRTAFDASLAGRAIARKSANAFGCTIKRVGL